MKKKKERVDLFSLAALGYVSLIVSVSLSVACPLLVIMEPLLYISVNHLGSIHGMHSGSVWKATVTIYVPQASFEPPLESHASYEASILHPSHHGWIRDDKVWTLNVIRKSQNSVLKQAMLKIVRSLYQLRECYKKSWLFYAKLLRNLQYFCSSLVCFTYWSN